VRPVRSASNLGFAGGVELGLRSAGGDLIGLLNDDAEAGAGWLAAAAGALDDPTVAAVTPKVLLRGIYAEVILESDPWYAPGDLRPLGRQLKSVTVGDVEVLEGLVGAGVHEVERDSGGAWRWTTGSRPFYVPIADLGAETGIRVDGEAVRPGPIVRIVNHAGSYLRAHGVAGEYGLGAPDDGRFDNRAERFGFSGTAPVFRHDTLRRLGAFATPFFAYNEDTDWCLRAHLAGLRIVYEPTATITHRLSATSGGPKAALVRYLAQRNSILCLVRNAPLDVARASVVRRLREGPGNGVRRGMLAKLPWAARSRLTMSRAWVTSPREVWDRWAERDVSWDDSPAAI
jgi:GT2 family glycosyltransferase